MLNSQAFVEIFSPQHKQKLHNLKKMSVRQKMHFFCMETFQNRPKTAALAHFFRFACRAFFSPIFFLKCSGVSGELEKSFWLS